MLLDATKEVEKQSVQIAEKIFDAGKVLCVALNKWDLVTDKEEKLLENPSYIKTPIVRNGKKATVGYCPDVWKEWE